MGLADILVDGGRKLAAVRHDAERARALGDEIARTVLAVMRHFKRSYMAFANVVGLIFENGMSELGLGFLGNGRIVHDSLPRKCCRVNGNIVFGGKTLGATGMVEMIVGEEDGLYGLRGNGILPQIVEQAPNTYTGIDEKSGSVTFQKVAISAASTSKANESQHLREKSLYYLE